MMKQRKLLITHRYAKENIKLGYGGLSQRQESGTIQRIKVLRNKTVSTCLIAYDAVTH